MQLDFRKVALKTLQNERASYTFNELKEYIDWEVKRVYWIRDCKQKTGEHCHFVENEFFIMVVGTCTAIIDCDNGKEDVPMAPSEGLVIGHHVWHGFKDFSSDAVLLAISSTNYGEDRSDYCEDYERYREILLNNE